jgi:hypothetical protein
MKTAMRIAHSQLARLLEAHEPTAGMYVRVHGDNLILGRREPFGSDSKLADDDRVRLTRLNSSSYGLSVRRHTGRWEKTPFSGSMEEMVKAMLTFMQHLVAPSPGCTGTYEARH